MAPFADLEAFLAPGGPTRVIAHRGCSGSAPENTLAAFRAAAQVGADMVELDVQPSRDGAVMVFHDEALDRTTDGRGPLAARTLAELRALDAGSWFDARFAGERIPTLAEALAALGPTLPVNVEVKPEAVDDRVEGGFVARVVDELRAAGFVERTLLSSFDSRALAQARALEPGLRRSQLYDASAHAGVPPAELLGRHGARTLSLAARQVRPGVVADVHAAGGLVLVYTVNELAAARRLAGRGVDGVFTDHPERLLAGLRAGGAPGA